jgi:hypothetical protein
MHGKAARGAVIELGSEIMKPGKQEVRDWTFFWGASAAAD